MLLVPFLRIYSQIRSPTFCFKSFMVLGLIFRLLNHFELILYMVWNRGPTSLFCIVGIELSQHYLLKVLFSSTGWSWYSCQNGHRCMDFTPQICLLEPRERLTWQDAPCVGSRLWEAFPAIHSIKNLCFSRTSRGHFYLMGSLSWSQWDCLLCV